MRSRRRWPVAVAASARAMAEHSFASSRSRRPMTSNLTPRATARAVSFSRYAAIRRMRASTSAGGRRQLSLEKANRVRMPTPASGAASTARRAASTPARCPMMRGSPRPVAHRPLPSMIIPTCRVLCVSKLIGIKKDSLLFPRGLDERFHVIQVALQRAPPSGRQPVIGARHAAGEALGAVHIPGLFQLPRMNTEVTVGSIQQFLEFAEGQRLVHGEPAENTQTEAFVDQAVELGGIAHGLQDRTLLAVAPHRAGFTRHISPRSRFQKSNAATRTRSAAAHSSPPAGRVPPWPPTSSRHP